MQFLYMGFSQKANIRSYKFRGVTPKERPAVGSKGVEFQLFADMALLARHRISVQDGPTLCLRILSASLAEEGADTVQFSSYAITIEDVSAYASARDAVAETKAARRKHRAPFKPPASSQWGRPSLK